MSHHDSLLRLINSDFFDSSQAVFYLHKYRNIVGIQYFICEKIKLFPNEEIDFLLPQLIHLLVNQTSESQALEDLILSKCRELGHTAILIYWYLQASAEDAKRNGPLSKFYRCRNLFHKCRSIIFENSPPLKPNGGYDTSFFTKALSRRKVRENTAPAIVGIGAVFASVICPQVMDSSRDLILLQGRRFRQILLDPETEASITASSNSETARKKSTTHDASLNANISNNDNRDFVGSNKQNFDGNMKRSASSLDTFNTPPTKDNQKTSKINASTNSLDKQNEQRRYSVDTMNYQKSKGIRLLARIPLSGPNTDELHRGDAFSFDSYVRNVLGIVAPESIKDIEGNVSSPSSDIAPSAFSSSIERSAYLHDPRYAKEVETLRSSFYFNAELRFMNALVDISDRLRSVPKVQRQSSLAAELELINHNLPADICLPSWCHASDPNENCEYDVDEHAEESEDLSGESDINEDEIETELKFNDQENAKDDNAISNKANKNNDENDSNDEIDVKDKDDVKIESEEEEEYDSLNQFKNMAMHKDEDNKGKSEDTTNKKDIADEEEIDNNEEYKETDLSVYSSDKDIEKELQDISIKDDTENLLNEKSPIEGVKAKVKKIKDKVQKAVSDTFKKQNYKPLNLLSHHRIVRISTTDCVVLNSADRVPFLVSIEVLEDESLSGKIDMYEGAGVGSSWRVTPLSTITGVLLPKSKDSKVKSLKDKESKKSKRVINRSSSRKHSSPTRRHLSPTSIRLSNDSVNKNTPPKSHHHRNISIVEDIDHYELVQKRRQSAATVSILSSKVRTGNSESSTPFTPGTIPSSLDNTSKPPLIPVGVKNSTTNSDDNIDVPNDKAEESSSSKDDSTKVELDTLAMPDLHIQVSSESLNSDASRRSSISSGEATPKTADSAYNITGNSAISDALIEAEDAAERMRTAAIMLAQLYKQQQRELSNNVVSTNSRANSGLGSILLGGKITVGAGGLPSMANKSSTTSLNNTTTSNVDSSKRNYQTLAHDFELVRTRLLKEMVDLEDKRIQALQNYRIEEDKLREQREMRLKKKHSKKRQEKLSTVASDDQASTDEPQLPAASQDVNAGLDEVLSETEEATLKNACIKKDKDDPSAAVFRETWASKVSRIRKESPYGKLPNWRLISCIVKSGADLRQEQLALQLIKEFQNIWREEGVPVWCCYFHIMITSDNSGLVETIKDASSIHQIKKEGYANNMNQKGIAYSLYDYFISEYGGLNSPRFIKARDNFMRSLAAYSVISYLLQIKDRHNGNILLDIHGHLIHIDFGFMLSNSPGSIGVELAPFKLPQDYIDILGGLNSEHFKEFRNLVFDAFDVIRKKADRLLGLVKIMEHESTLDCFTGQSSKPQNFHNVNIQAEETVQDSSAFLNFMGIEYDMPSSKSLDPTIPSPHRQSVSHANKVKYSNSTMDICISSQEGYVSDGEDDPVKGISVDYSSYKSSASISGSAKKSLYPVTETLKSRFCINMPETQLQEFVNSLIDKSCNSAYTKMYDNFQYYANGIL